VVTLEELFAKACASGSPMAYHLPWLRSIAQQARVVVELGTGDGVSTTALLAAAPLSLRTVDIKACPAQSDLEPLAERTMVEWIVASSLDVEPIECDLLFIDTEHTGKQVFEELTRHGPLVRRWIALHDTEGFAWWDNDSRAPGLWPGIWRWLRDHPEWRIAYMIRESWGMTLLERLPPIR
jgi:hypothetical protein